MPSTQRGRPRAIEIVVPARNEARRLPESLALLCREVAALGLPAAIARCPRLGAALTEIPVHWRDVTGSTFSVPRHSAAVFRDVAALWLRSRESSEPAPLPAYPQPLQAQAIGAMGTTPA